MLEAWQVFWDDLETIDPENPDDSRFLSQAAFEYLLTEIFNNFTLTQRAQSILARCLLYQRLGARDFENTANSIEGRDLVKKAWKLFIPCEEDQHYFLAVVDADARKIKISDSFQSIDFDGDRFRSAAQKLHAFVELVFGQKKFTVIQVEVSLELNLYTLFNNNILS